MEQEKNMLIKHFEEVLGLMPEGESRYDDLFIAMENTPYRDLRNPNLRSNPINQFYEEVLKDYNDTKIRNAIKAAHDQMEVDFYNFYKFENKLVYDCECLISQCPTEMQPILEKNVNEMYQMSLSELYESNKVDEYYQSIMTVLERDPSFQIAYKNAEAQYTQYCVEKELDTAQKLEAEVHQMEEQLAEVIQDTNIELEDEVELQENIEVEELFDSELESEPEIPSEVEAQIEAEVNEQKSKMEEFLELAMGLSEEEKEAIIERLEQSVQQNKKDKKQEYRDEIKQLKSDIKEIDEELEKAKKEIAIYQKFLKKNPYLEKESQVFISINSKLDGLEELRKTLLTNSQNCKDLLKQKQNVLRALSPNVLTSLAKGFEDTANWLKDGIKTGTINIANKAYGVFSMAQGFFGMKFSKEAIQKAAQNVNTFADATVNKLHAQANLRIIKNLQPALEACNVALMELENKYDKKIHNVEKELKKAQEKLQSDMDINRPEYTILKDNSEIKKQIEKIEKLKADFAIEAAKRLNKAKKHLDKYKESSEILKNDKQEAKKAIFNFIQNNSLKFMPGLIDAQGHVVGSIPIKIEDLDNFSKISDSMVANGYIKEARALECLTKLVEYGRVDSAVTKEVLNNIIADEKQLNSQLSEVNDKVDLDVFCNKADELIFEFEHHCLNKNFKLDPIHNTMLNELESSLKDYNLQQGKSFKELVNRDDEAR